MFTVARDVRLRDKKLSLSLSPSVGTDQQRRFNSIHFGSPIIQHRSIKWRGCLASSRNVKDWRKNSCFLFEGNIQELALRDWWKSRRTSTRIPVPRSSFESSTSGVHFDRETAWSTVRSSVIHYCVNISEYVVQIVHWIRKNEASRRMWAVRVSVNSAK